MAGGGRAGQGQGSIGDALALPPVLYRWLDEDQTRDLLFGGGMAADWTHLCPDTLLAEKGVSFGENPWRWREEDEYVACVALSTEVLPASLRPIKLDGYDAFHATAAWRRLGLDARKTTDLDARRAMREKARAVAADFAGRHATSPEGGDEWFLRGPIPDALGRTLAMATLNPDFGLERLIEQMAADGTVPMPIHRLDPYAGGDPRRLEAETRRVFSDIDPALAEPAAALGPR